MVKRDVYTELSNRFARLEKHYISLEVDLQLNQQNFQKDKSCKNQNAPEFSKYFENNDLKAQLQENDTTISKLRNHIKSLRESDKKDRVKQDMDEIETINIELEYSVAKLLSKNELLHKEIEHLKKIYKDKFDSIKKTRALSKEHSKNVLDNASTITNATTIAPGMFKLDKEPISHRLKNNRDAHTNYLKKTIENTNTICGLVERARKQNPSEPLLESACVFTKHVHELLVYVSKTCPSLTKYSEKLVAVIPKNMDKKVRFADPVTSLNNTQQ
ncbi:hypothetical protein Tco_0451839 [Tanacetum coccineum]